MLGRKLLRELLRQRGQTVAVLAVVAIGVLLYCSSDAAYRDLRDSYAATRARLALADLHVDVTHAGPDDVARVAAIAGVTAVEPRRVAEVSAMIGSRHVELRVLSLPERGEPRLDRLLVLSGRIPASPDEIILEKHLASRHRLHPGDAIELAGGGTVRVTGIAVSAEYLWVARDAQDFMPSPDSFGVGWMREPALAGRGGVRDQLLVMVRAGADGDEVAGRIRDAIGPARFERAIPQRELVGVRLLQLDVDGYQGMAALFPILFLGVGGLIVASTLARLVDAQRPLIGTLMALGVGRARILGHYLAYGVVLGAAGALLGAAAGRLLGPAMTRAYAVELGIPFVTTHRHGDLAAWGMLLGTVTAALAAIAPAWRASSSAPAEAMRPPRPNTGPLARLARRLRAPLAVRMAIRNILGRPLRSLATAMGVAAAVAVVVITAGLLESMRVTFDATFEQARRDDLRVDLAAPTPLAHIGARVATVDGVTAVEGILAVPAVIDVGRRQAEVLLQGLDGGARLVRSLDADGRAVAPPPGGIVLTRGLGHLLHVHAGDDVQVRAGGAVATLRVAGFADAALGPVASARRQDIAGALGLGDQVTQVALAVDRAHRERAVDALAALPEVTRVEDTDELRLQMNELMKLGWAMLATMLAFAGILAAAILFNTATLGVLEHRRDLATLESLGVSFRELVVGITVEHAVLALAGLALGLPVAVSATRRVAAMFSSDLFSLPGVVSFSVLASTAGGVLIVVLVAQLPALRSLARTSLAEAVRTREG